jgi:two-component system chemotaxis response regulator CheY
MRTLIVEDSLATRRLISAAVKELGVREALEAASAEEADAFLTRTPDVDLIITDWHMPGMSGLDLLKKLRASARHKNTPVVLITSETSGESVVAALRAGATNYIIKPFNKQQLEDKIGPVIHKIVSEESQKRADSWQEGHVRDGELGSLIQYFIQTRQTGCCDLEFTNCVGKIAFKDGQITGAMYQLQRGEPAFLTCMSGRPKRYSFRVGEIRVPPDCAISKPSITLLLEALATNDGARA